MTKLKVLRSAAVVATALSLTTGVGVAAAANSSSIHTTGPGSNSSVDVRHEDSRSVRNNNNVNARNDNPQHASTGDVSVRRNTTGGSAQSGMVENDSLATTNVTVSNSGAHAGGSSMSAPSSTATIRETGPDSDTNITHESSVTHEVENNNSFMIENRNDQSASSGSVEVEGNTRAGNARSGDARNISTSEVTIRVTN